MAACEDTEIGTPDKPSEFSRAHQFVTFCDDGRALPETEVGPVALALFLGAPSRAYPTEGR